MVAKRNLLSCSVSKGDVGRNEHRLDIGPPFKIEKTGLTISRRTLSRRSSGATKEAGYCRIDVQSQLRHD
jgi:hypothetical protein